MHQVRVALAAPLLLALLSGCLGGDEPVTPAADEEPVLMTRPDADAASEPGWHLHDYWEGATRLVAVDQTIEYGGTNCNGCDRIPVRFRGDAGMLVPLGTSHLEITVEWNEESGDHGQPELWVKTADAREPEWVATVESGKTIVLNTTNEHADPPHQVLSRWEFWVMLPAIQQAASFSGDISVFGEAFRGADIPAFPPHPDLWNGQSEIELFTVTNAPVIQVEDVDAGSRTCQMGCLSVHAPADGITVPYDASEVVVTLTYGAGLPATLGLLAHGGDTWDMAPIEGELAPPNGAVYRIPVSATTGDSPYAKQSIWEFLPFIDQPAAQHAFVGGYTLRAVAVK